MIKFIPKINDKDIDKFPPEWREPIRTHIAGSMKIVTSKHVSGYVVRISRIGDDIYLITELVKAGSRYNCDFPARLQPNGSFEFHLYRGGDLPEEHKVQSNGLTYTSWTTRQIGPESDTNRVGYRWTKFRSRHKYAETVMMTQSQFCYSGREFCFAVIH